MRNYKELEIWQRSMSLVTTIYKETRSFPDTERYGLTSQIRRSAVSIPSNIAEGCSRSSKKELVRFLEISIGSAFELETQIIISTSTAMLPSSKANIIIKELNEIQRMLNAYRSAIKYKV